MSRPLCGFKLLNGPRTMRNGKPVALLAKWDGLPKRAPKKGELFISGAIPTAYRAVTDMTTEYWIAVEVPQHQ